MSFPIAILSAPLPWLAFIVSKIFGSKNDKEEGDGKESLKSSFFPRSLKITREGGWYIGALIVIGFAAINTGNNLLYLVVAMLLSLIIISGILSESTLRGLSVKRLMPTHLYPNKDLSIKLIVNNKKKRLPSYSFTIEEAFHSTNAKKKNYKEDFTSTVGYILKLNPSDEGACSIVYNFKRRGRVRLKALRIKTRFPFGLFIKGKLEEIPQEVIIYPATRVVAEKELPIALHGGTVRLPKAGIGIELHNIKEYRPGEDSRHIDWKASARSRTIMRKEFEEESERQLTITFKNLNDREENFEAAVVEAASLAKHYLSKDYSVSLVTLSSTVNHARGSKQLKNILHTLALIKPVKEDGRAEVLLRVT